MSAAPVEWDDDDDPDAVLDEVTAPKKNAVPLKRTPKQQAAIDKAEAARELASAQSGAQQQAVMLAQIVNLHIAGMSLAQIGASIGATEAEVDRMLTQESARYVRNQPALRTYVRNYISGKYTSLLEAVWDGAVDKKRADQLEHVDRAERILTKMGRLHGAEAPTQTEVKVEAAPEAVDRLVQAIATGQGLGYDTDIFDIDEDDIHEAVTVSAEQVEVSGNALEQRQEGDPDEGF